MTDLHAHLTCHHDSIVVRQIFDPSLTAGGLVIPDAARKEKPMRGVVQIVGPGKWYPFQGWQVDPDTTNDPDIHPDTMPFVQGLREPMPFAPGDLVFFGRYAGIAVPGDDTLLVLRSAEVQISVPAEHVQLVEHPEQKTHLAGEPCELCDAPKEAEARSRISDLRARLLEGNEPGFLPEKTADEL